MMHDELESWPTWLFKKAVGYGLPTLFFTAAISAHSLYDEYQTMAQDLETGEPTQGYAVFTGTSNRIEKGVKLVENHKGSKLLISGANSGFTQKNFAKIFNPQIPEQDVEIWDYANNTQGNAEETAQWIKNNNLQSVTIITSAYHAPRALQELTSLLEEGVSIRLKTVGNKPVPYSKAHIQEMAKMLCIEIPKCSNALRPDPLKKPLPETVQIRDTHDFGG